MEEAEAWARTQVGELYAAGRGFAEREHVHTGQYLPDSTVSAQADACRSNSRSTITTADLSR